MKRKKINFKYLLLIPAFFIGINSFAQQKQAPEKVSAKEITTNKIATQQAVKTDIPVQKVEIDKAVISNSKQEAATAGRTTSTSPSNTTAVKTTQSTSTNTRAVEKYDKALISNKKPANYDADRKKAPSFSDKPTKK